MPWYCGHCRRWNKTGHHCCPDCGRPPKGRLCRSCKTAVSKSATFCTSCGSRRLSDPAVETFPFTVPVRLVLLLAALLLTFGATQALAPVFISLFQSGLQLLARVLFAAVCFWLVTGLLPSGWGSRVRETVWKLVSFFGRFLVNLFK